MCENSSLMAESLISKNLISYLDSLVPERSPELLAMEAYAREKSFPIIGPAAGYFLYQIARMVGATRVFEMGSGYGYSTAWFARAVKENGGGTVHHVVWNEELSKMARRHLSVLGYEDIVQYTVGEAIQALKETTGTYGLIFNDIDKEAYPESLAVIADKLAPGGILIVDNMLWWGRVLDARDQAESTTAIRELTRLLVSDDNWITTIVPIRDGLLLAYKSS
jgi:predicted O-methyltransferase YrrM